MSDDADRSVECEQRLLDRQIAIARAPIAAGSPGECVDCEREMARLVGGRCAPCRDGRAR